MKRWPIVLVLLALGCGSSDDSSGGGGSSGGGAGGGSGGSAGSGGSTGGSSGSAGASTGGAAGSPICPNAIESTVVTSIPNAVWPAPNQFQGGDTPELDLSGPDPNWTWNDPHVLKVGSEYWMYASATDFFQFPVRLYRLVSSDGVSWQRNPTEPILDVGAPGTFDAGGVETPAVIYFAGRYHLFYTAYPIKVNDPGYGIDGFRIGHATSCDGVSWTRDPAPILGHSDPTDSDPTNDWYQLVVGEPGPVVHDGQLYLYFTAAGFNAKLAAGLQVVGLVTSADGVTWSGPKEALEPDQSQYDVTQGWTGYSTPNAIELNGQVHLFFDVAFDPDGSHWEQIRLHHAVSPDGMSGFVQDTAPIAKAGDFSWAVAEIRSPDAFIDGTTLRLWFAGHELDGTPPDHFAIGEMSYDLAP